MKNYMLILFLIAAYACGNANNNESHEQHNAAIPKTASDSLYKSVMDGHDTGMEKIGELIRLKELVKQQRDSINNLNGKAKESVAKFDAAYNDLVSADELMNKWMQDFDPDKAGSTEVEKLDFFRKEKEKVDTVNVRISNSIEKAKEITAARP